MWCYRKSDLVKLQHAYQTQIQSHMEAPRSSLAFLPPPSAPFLQNQLASAVLGPDYTQPGPQALTLLCLTDLPHTNCH